MASPSPSPSPFGFLLPPLAPLVPPELEAQGVSTNQLAYSFPAASVGQTLAVFLLPGQSLPAGSAAALYIQFPGQAEFKFLGALGEGKASAVFRVAGLRASDDDVANVNNGGQTQTFGGEVDMDAPEDQQQQQQQQQAQAVLTGNVTVGVSLEPADEVAQKVAAQRAARQANGTTATADGGGGGMALARRGAFGAQGQNAAVVGGQQQQQQPSTKVLAQRIIKNAFNFLASFEGGTGMVPIKAFEGWWQKFERRVENDPGFLEREQD